MKRLSGLLFILIIGCATSPYRRLEKIHVGLSKDSLLDLMGSPQEAKYKNEEDIWVYRVMYEAHWIVKEIRLKQDVVIAVKDISQSNIGQMNRLQEGMSEEEVLDTVGLPNRTVTRNGHQFWVYTSDGKNGVELKFKNKKLKMVGSQQALGVDANQSTENFTPIE